MLNKLSNVMFLFCSVMNIKLNSVVLKHIQDTCGTFDKWAIKQWAC